MGTLALSVKTYSGSEPSARVPCPSQHVATGTPGGSLLPPRLTKEMKLYPVYESFVKLKPSCRFVMCLICRSSALSVSTKTK